MQATAKRLLPSQRSVRYNLASSSILLNARNLFPDDNFLLHAIYIPFLLSCISRNKDIPCFCTPNAKDWLICKVSELKGGMQVVESTGCVMVPYQQYPNLMGALLSMLADRNNETLRYPVIIVSCLICLSQIHVLPEQGKLQN